MKLGREIADFVTVLILLKVRYDKVIFCFDVGNGSSFSYEVLSSADPLDLIIFRFQEI